MGTNKSRGIVFLFGLVFIGVSIFVYFLSDSTRHQHEEDIQSYLDMQLKDFFTKMDERNNITAIAAVILANNEQVKTCLRTDNKNICKSYFEEVQDTFNNMSFSQNLKIHIHTKDFKTFLRAWDLTDGRRDSLFSFRHSLEKVKNTKQVLFGVEVGRRSLMIRGVAPVVEAKEYLGSLEVMTDFKSITRYFKEKEIDFFVLIHNKYEDIATQVAYPLKKRFNNFVIVNDVNSGLDMFRDLEFSETSYVKKNNFYILSTPIYDIANNKIGFYVLKIPASAIP